MARRLLILYLLIVLGPALAMMAVWALRDLLARQRRVSPEGNGHAEAEGLEHTVEEVRAT